MRLLLINPNVTAAVTERMAAEARLAASAGTEIVPITAAFGSEYVATRPEAAIAGHAVLDALARHDSGCDAAIVAAYGDPGLAAAREFAAVPVFGPTEASLLIAWTLARRIAIVCLTPRLRRWYIECAEEHGLAARIVAVRALAGPVPDIVRAKEQFQEQLLAECRRVVTEDEAEAVILGGGPIAGLARELAPLLPVPTLDPIACAVRLAEAVVGLAPRQPGAGSFARPAGKPAKGLGEALLRRMSGG